MEIFFSYSYRFINEPNVLSKFKKIAEDFLKEIGLTTFVKRTDNLKEVKFLHSPY
jgi:hypothetical protein